jgi:hypothetical protein
VESRARRFLPASTPVAATTSLTVSKIRCGRALAAIRRRQYVNTDGWNPVRVTANPHAAFYRRSKVTASAACRSDSPCNACRTITDAITSAGIDGRPRLESNWWPDKTVWTGFGSGYGWIPLLLPMLALWALIRARRRNVA